jgi:hypothetical protein
MLESAHILYSLRAVVKYDIADHIGASDVDVTLLAPELALEPNALHRMLRFLSLHGYFSYVGGTMFRESDLTAALRSAPGSRLRSTLVSVGTVDDLVLLSETVRTGESAFSLQRGADFWSWHENHPGDGLSFAQYMEAQVYEVTALATDLTWSGYDLIADMGGGSGQLLATILAANPSCQGLLVDVPDSAILARNTLAERGLSNRCDVLSMDFRVEAPAAAMYILSRVLLDWSDEDVHRILAAIRAAAPATGRLRIFESLLDTEGNPRRSLLSDMSMLLTFGSSAGLRSLSEISSLLDGTGWELVDSRLAGSGLTSLEAVAV